MTIRTLTPSDVCEYRTLRLCALREWPPAFGTPAEYEEQLTLRVFSERLVETEDRCLIGVFEDDALVGSIRLFRYEGSNEAHRAYLAGFFVKPERRGLGYGRELLGRALARAELDEKLRRLNLTVVAGQESALSLYVSYGFVRYGVDREVFRARGLFFDEILMTLDLQSRRIQSPAATTTALASDVPAEP